MPDAVTAAPPIRSLVWSLLGALVALWLGYAIVAGMKQSPSAAPPAAHAPAALKATPVGLSLTPAPALRVRSSLFGPGPVAPVVASPKPQTTLTAKPKPSSGGGFDQSSASGFDQSG